MFTRYFLLAIFSLSFISAYADDCQYSKWGKDDEIGSANYVNPDQVLMASKLIKEGKTQSLGIVIEPGMPAYPPRYVELQVVQPGQQHGYDTVKTFNWPATVNDDLVQMWLGVGPQLDGFGHMGEKGVFYNCNDASEVTDITGMKKLGTEKIPPLVGRGVLLDMTKHFNVEYMQLGQPITTDDIKLAAKSQNIKFQKGDVILFYTGWTDKMLKSDPDLWNSGEPGITNDAAKYLSSLNPMAIGSDTWGVEVVPAIEGDKLFYGHITLLKENGILILETMNTGELVRENVNEFMFVLGQPKIKGTVQMIINPVALW